MTDTNKRNKIGLMTTAFWLARKRAKEAAKLRNLFDAPLIVDLHSIALCDDVARLSQDGRDLEHKFDNEYHRLGFGEFWDPLPWMKCVGITQIVLLGAGMDSRAFRLQGMPQETIFYELDFEELIRIKDEKLRGVQPICNRVSVAVDFDNSESAEGWDNALLRKGFDPKLPSLFVAEGFLKYFNKNAQGKIKRVVRRLMAPKSIIIGEAINDAVIDYVWTKPLCDVASQAGAPWTGVFSKHDDWKAEWQSHNFEYYDMSIWDLKTRMRAQKSKSFLAYARQLLFLVHSKLSVLFGIIPEAPLDILWTATKM